MPINSYNNSTCTFTAPVSGAYSFSSYLTLTPAAYGSTSGGVIFGFAVNNTMDPAQAPIVVASPGTYETNENLSFSGILYLNAGDEVRIGVFGADNGENFNVSYVGFSGFKIN